MDENLVGYLSGESNLEGMLSGESELTGYISAGTEAELTGELSIPPVLGELYDGEYDVIPEGDFKLLPTQGRYVVDDIIVYPIPYSEVSNLKGGYTATIGG